MIAVDRPALAPRTLGPALAAFAESVGADGPVRVVGGRSHWNVGRRVDQSADSSRADDVRDLRAPVGVVSVEPDELIVRVGAGTTVAELDAALAGAGLQCPLDPLSGEATVGGVLVVGQSGVRRLRHGHVRDVLLEAMYVGADGETRRAGAPLVKNVTGFDLPRLLVGSLGSIGFLGDVVLRCGPRPAVRVWLSAKGMDPWEVRRSLYRPSSILWDGVATFVQLEGTPGEVASERSGLPGSQWSECAAPALSPQRSSVAPATLRRLRDDDPSSVFGVPVVGPWMVEIGVGTVFGVEVPAPSLAPPVLDVQRRIKDAFDPTGRLNPGVLPW